MRIVKSAEFGGTGGKPFGEPLPEAVRIEKITIDYARLVHRLEIVYVLDNEERATKAWGEPVKENTAEILLAEDERICAVGIRCGQYVDALTIVTYRLFNLSAMRQCGPFGGPGGRQFTVLSPNIREFFGRAGLLLDAVGVRGEDPLLVF